MSDVVSYTQRVKWIRTPCEAGACIEIGKLPHGDYAIRNSRFRANTVVVTEEEMTAFLKAVHDGVFNSVVEVIR